MPEKSYWLDRRENVARLYRGLWCVGLVLLLADLLVDRHDGAHFAERIGFYCLYGFIACVALVLAAKALRRVLMRPEDYYDR
jgi:hypothetical protein